MPVLGACQRGWLLSAVTPKDGHVPFGQSPLANMHHWHWLAELGVLGGNPRGFGSAGNEMRRGREGPLGRGGLGLLPRSGPGEQKRNPQ